MTQLSRRTLFRAAGAGALTASAAPVLIGCGDGENTTGVGNAGADLVPFPTWIPFEGPTPDLPADESGVQPGYLSAPQDLVAAVPETPGDGSDVTAMVITYQAPPPPVDGNRFWQAVNEALGVNLKVTVVPVSEYPQKMATVMAGGDLPDIMMFGGGIAIAREQEFIASQCADLSEFIAGDAVAEYPSLANIPPYAWQGLGRIGGRLHGIPLERPKPGLCLLVNRTMLDEVGAPARWSQPDYFTAMAAVTGRNTWAIGAARDHLSSDTAARFHAASHGAPHTWQVTDGAFVSAFETPEFEAALATMKELASGGLYHPDSTSVSLTDMKTHLQNGTVASMADGFAAFSTSALDAIDDRFVLDFALPFGEGNLWQSPGRFGYAVFKQAPAERIRLLLRVCNYLAAPFGTVEHALVTWGVDGTHYTRTDSGDITPTELASVEVKTLPLYYIAAAPKVIYFPGRPEAARRVHEWEQEVLATTVANPANGLQSETWTARSAELNRILGDGIAAIVFGDDPVSEWASIMDDWRAAGGDQVAEEYAAEHAATEDGPADGEGT